MRKLKPLKAQPVEAPAHRAEIAARTAGSPPRAADASCPEAESPARTLQEQLREAWVADETVPDARWAPASTLLLAGGVSTLVWGLVAWTLFGHR
jgi:hypothetical protein